MKKYSIPFMFLLLFPFGIKLNAQTASENHLIRVWYVLNGETIEDPQTSEGYFRLDIINDSSKFYEFYKYNRDSLVVDFLKKNPNAQGYPGWMGPKCRYTNPFWTDFCWSSLVKDLSKSTLTVFAYVYAIGAYKYAEDIPQFNWSLREDTLIIGNYICQKAECYFGGRDYIAWFTSEIPIKNGPWKFGGLPGLILKVEDKDKYNTFEFVKLEILDKNTTTRIFNPSRFKEIKREKLLKLNKNMFEDWVKTTGAVPMSPIKTVKKEKKPYNPLELE